MVDYLPAVARQSTGRRDAWFQSHFTTVLQRDIQDLAKNCRHDRRSAAVFRSGSPRGRTAELRRPAENDGPVANKLIVFRLYTRLYTDARKILSTASKEFVRHRLANLPVVIFQTVSEKSTATDQPIRSPCPIIRS